MRVAAAPAEGNWCVAGGFQGWNNTSHALADDGSGGDLIAGDGVFSRDVAIADAGRNEFKVVECGNWGKAYPSNNDAVQTMRVIDALAKKPDGITKLA